MSRLAPVLALFAAGCVTTPEVGSADGAALEGYRPELAEGHAAEAHTEVAPGIFLLTDAIERGAVRYVPEAEEAARRERPEVGYCYNYESATFADELANGSMFGANPSWYGVANAYSYKYDPPGDRYDQDYTQVSAYLWAYNAEAVGMVSVSAYVYVNGTYVGYVYDTAMADTLALQYGAFDATCVDGSATVEVKHYLSWYDPRRGQSLSVGQTTTTTVACCP